MEPLVLLEQYAFKVEQYYAITPRKAWTLIQQKEAVLLDIRSLDLIRFKQFDIPDVFYLCQMDVTTNLSQLPSDKIIIIADSTSNRVIPMMNILKEKGFCFLASLAGGFVEWEKDGLPIKVFKENRLSGSCTCQLRLREKKMV
ncbi:MAG: rhodanese-like domain-containing protein [Bacteroidales bacterium]|nr:rhodanese-like domain-containing protein [Bacteroidales bacterium]